MNEFCLEKVIHNMKHLKSAVCWILFTVLALTGCSAVSPEKTKQPGDKIQVYTSIYPLYDFAKKIGGEHAVVTNLVPPGVEPHDFEFTARDMSKMSEADLFVYNGGGFEPWIERVSRMLNPEKTKIVEASKPISLLRDDQHGGQTDPHVWLDPMLAKKQASAILDALIQLDPQHQKDYEKNYEALAAGLDQLDREYRDMMEKAAKKEFAVSHASFSYLAKRYGLTQIAVSGLSPSDEPSPKELQQVVEQVKSHDIDVIFFETLVSNRIANVVKKEAGAEVLVLNPLEGLTEQEMKQGKDYFSVMRENKENLAKALGVSSTDENASD